VWTRLLKLDKKIWQKSSKIQFDFTFEYKMESIIEGRAKIIDMRKKSCIYGDQGNFKELGVNKIESILTGV